MATIIGQGQLGAYEFALVASTELTITVTGTIDTPINNVTINVHTATNPVYAKWSTVTVQDQGALQIAPGTWKSLANTGGTTTQTLHLISAGAATVSVEAF